MYFFAAAPIVVRSHCIFMASIEDGGMGEIFREGSFQLDMHCTSFPGSGNDRLVVDLQRLLDLEKDVGSMESCF